MAQTQGEIGKMDLLSLGRTPISDDQPAGADVRYEPDFEQLQDEIDKLSIPSAAGDFDWNIVADMAAAILAGKSKDLLVAGYLAVSQIYINNLEGLATGLQIVNDLIDQYWENLFPPKKRMRGRLAAIDWWIEKTETALDRVELKPVAAEILSKIQANIVGIDGFLVNQFEDPPSLRPIQRILETVVADEPVPETTGASLADAPQPQTAATPRQAPAADIPPAPSSPQLVASDGDVRNATNTVQQTLRKIAAYLQERDVGNAMAYRYRRLAAWSQISDLPPAVNGQTQIPPPSPQMIQPLMDLRNNGNLDAFLLAAEQRFSQFIYWFDLHRWVVETMAGLGDAYQPAQETVCQETAFLLYRLPGLESLTFNDGTPFADSDTQKWLKSIEFGAGAVAFEPNLVSPTVPSTSDTDAMFETIEQARDLMKKKQSVEAVQLLQDKLGQSSSKKEKMLWRMALCQILFGAKRSETARPHLDLLLKDIDRHDLTNWDPDMALEAFKVVWTGFMHFSDTDTKQQADAVINRIAELNPVDALRLAK